MPYSRSRVRDSSRAALADLTHAPYWLDRPIRPEPAPALVGPSTADLVIVGGGFTGLWTALLAVEADPGREVVVLEGDRLGEGASGRNGGFMAASITHGFGNGLARWPDELAELTEQGRANLDAIAETIARYSMDVDYARTGELDVATEEYQVAELAELPELAAPYGERLEFLDAAATRALVDSPLYRGAVRDRQGVALVDPAKLTWELARVVRELGGRIHEHSAVTGLSRQHAGVAVRTAHGQVLARQVALGTSAYPNLLRRVRPFIIPVYDYALVTEPLTDAQWASVGWDFGGGVGDANNQFHYSRPTADGRVLWGGFEAIYHYGSAMGPQLNRDDRTYAVLAENFFETFPQLEGLRFSHGWGGAIDTCSRFSAFWGTALDGRVAYSVGYTGLGVGTTRFGAQVMLDLLDGGATRRTALEMVRTKPIPFPPEPLRSPAVAATRWSLDRADNNEGRRNLWLRTLDRLGLGFDS
ncbi:MAG: FAD-binding oxidoreductase [Candidatus Nanopelagicales bacterium]